jgi:hypothetical protein
MQRFQSILSPRLDLVVETLRNVRDRVELPLPEKKETLMDESIDEEESVD